MKKTLTITKLAAVLTLALATTFTARAEDLKAKSEEAVQSFKQTDPGLADFFSKAAGYAILPKVGEGGCAGDQIVLSDCRDCSDDIGMMVTCRGAQRPAEVTVHRAAVENGQEGAVLPIVLTIDKGQIFERQATTRYFGLIGYTPEFPLERDDPLIATLQAGYSLKINFSGQTTELTLRGSRSAFDIFRAQCGGNQTATPPGNEAKWLVQTYPAGDSDRFKTFLTYGIPETDAIVFSASCESGWRGSDLAVDLLIGSGGKTSGQPVDVKLQGPNPAGLARRRNLQAGDP
jgi:hypothetical protein